MQTRELQNCRFETKTALFSSTIGHNEVRVMSPENRRKKVRVKNPAGKRAHSFPGHPSRGKKRRASGQNKSDVGCGVAVVRIVLMLSRMYVQPTEMLITTIYRFASSLGPQVQRRDFHLGYSFFRSVTVVYCPARHPDPPAHERAIKNGMHLYTHPLATIFAMKISGS